MRGPAPLLAAMLGFCVAFAAELIVKAMGY